MNLKEVLSISDFSISQLLIALVAKNYFKSKDYSKNKVGLTVDILKSKESYFKENHTDRALQYLINGLVVSNVLTEDGHAGSNMELILAKTGAKSVSKTTIALSKPALERQQDFKMLLASYKGTYSKEMLTEFYNWWGAIDMHSQLMRFECKEFFETDKRLQTWYKRNYSHIGPQKPEALSFSID